MKRWPRPRRIVTGLVAACGLLVFSPDHTHSQTPPVVSRDIKSYVLFAAGQVELKGGNTSAGDRGIIDGGNVGANGVGLDSGTPEIAICTNGTARMSDGTQMVGDTVRFTPLCDVWDAFFNTNLGSEPQGVARNFQGPFTPPVLSMPTFPSFACDPDAPDLIVAKGDTAMVSPGVYGEVTFHDNSRVAMEAGEYRVCSFHTGQDVQVTTAPGVTMLVQEQWELSPGAEFGGTGCAGIPRVLVRGTGIGNNDNSINFSTQTDAWGHFYAASHRIGLGRDNDLHGTFWAGQLQGEITGHIGSDFNTNVEYCPPSVPRSDLSIVKRARPTTVPAGGGQVFYALVVRNHGPADDPDVHVTDPMAPGLTLVSARPSQGSCSTANNTVSCDLGALEAGAAALVLVRATTTGSPGCIPNTASVDGENPDPNPDDNEDSAQVCVPTPQPEPPTPTPQPEPPTPSPQPEPSPTPTPQPPERQHDLRVAAVVASAPEPSPTPTPQPEAVTGRYAQGRQLVGADRRVVVGELVRYRVAVTNHGPAAAPNVIVADTLNAPVRVVSARATKGSCRIHGPTVLCRPGRIAAGERVTITTMVRHREKGCGQRNAAAAISDGQDSKPRNNLALVNVCAAPRSG
jgi:uncharacterized repeat protein (TIGR01451 family)